MGSCQKLGIILENKVIERLLLSKNVNYKKSAPKFVFFNEKNEKESDDFWHRKLSFESQIFPLFDTSTLRQFAKLYNFLTQPKTFLILYPSFENSKTIIAIVLGRASVDRFELGENYFLQRFSATWQNVIIIKT